MATISFYGNITDDSQDLISHQAGSGIGFFGSDFGVPVPIGETQTTTWITTADGAGRGAQLKNTQFITEGEGAVEGTVKLNNTNTINLSRLPNYQSTLNIRFEHETAVIASQPKVIVFNRQSINNHAVDVVTYVYESRHPLVLTTQSSLSHRASTNFVWTIFDPAEGGIPNPMPLTNSPGPSGLNTVEQDMAGDYLSYLRDTLGFDDTDINNFNNGSTGRFTRHDWYVALSSSPTDIGEKTQYGLYFTVDYL